MTVREIGNGIFEALRLATVQSGYFPDIVPFLNPKDPMGFFEAKQVILSSGKELIEVFNVGGYNARPRRKTNDIALDLVVTDKSKRGTITVPEYTEAYTPPIAETRAVAQVEIDSVIQGEEFSLIIQGDIPVTLCTLTTGAETVTELMDRVVAEISANFPEYLLNRIALGQDGYERLDILAPVGMGVSGNRECSVVFTTTGNSVIRFYNFYGGVDSIAPKKYFLKTLTAKNLYDIDFQLQYIAYSEEYASIIEDLINKTIGAHAALYGYNDSGYRLNDYFVIIRQSSFDTSGSDFIERGIRFTVPAKDLNTSTSGGAIAENIEIKIDLEDLEENTLLELTVPL